jgi:nucleoside-diphosphate-sugar epimerase
MAGPGRAEVNGKRVLVTGAAGMLGRRIVAALTSAGHSVHGVDLVRPQGADAAARFTVASLQDWDGLEAALAASDCAVHAAAIANLESAPEPVVFANNVAATSRIVYAAAAAKLERLVYVSSQSALGFSRALTVIPPDYVPVDETHRCHLTEGYGVSKLVGEQLCDLASYRFGLTTLCLRYPVIWAPENFAAHTAKRIGDPTQAAKSMWSYVDVRDAARAVALAVACDLPRHAVLNISAPWPFCAGDIAGLVAERYGSVERRGPIGPQAAVYATAQAEALLGFRAAYRWTADGIEEGA